MPGIRVLGAYMPEEPVGRHLIKQIGARLGREAKHVLQPLSTVQPAVHQNMLHATLVSGDGSKWNIYEFAESYLKDGLLPWYIHGRDALLFGTNIQKAAMAMQLSCITF